MQELEDKTAPKKPKKKTRKPRIHCDYRVKLYEDGKYHWLYDVHLLKNPAILMEVYWVLGITLAIFALILFTIHACDSGFKAEGLLMVLKITGIMGAGMLVLGLLAYLLYAALAGWTYSVHFIMDEQGVEHRQAPRAQKVAKGLGFLTVLVGLASRRPGVAGAGVLSASRTSMSTDFKVVKKVKAMRWMDTIKVHEPFGRNQVYVGAADFDFVYDFISRHCPKAKIS